jgi:hypothetical protein
METLQALATIIKDLPDTAIWIIAIYFFFKMFVVGSIYGVIRLAIMKAHDVLLTKKTQKVDIEATIKGITISNDMDALISQLHRLRGVRVGINSQYIHGSSVDFLRDALDAQFEKENQSK